MTKKKNELSLQISRRRFLQTTAATSLVSGCGMPIIRPEEYDELAGKEVLTFQLYRPEDRFSAKLEVYGFELKTLGERSFLIAKPGSLKKKRRFVYTLPPQHNAETALERTLKFNKEIERPINIPKQSLLSSKPSVLVFDVPEAALVEDGSGMEFSLENLLSWEKFEYVAENADDPYLNDPPFYNGSDPEKAKKRRFLLGLEVWKGQNADRVSAIDRLIYPADSICNLRNLNHLCGIAITPH